MTIDLKPAHKQIIGDALRRGRFRSIDEALDQALQSVAPAATADPRRTPAEAAARLRELRKGNLLPPGVTLRGLIEYGRA